MLQSLPVTLDHTESLQNARAQLRRNDYQALLTEAALPDGNWLDALHLARECAQSLEVVVTGAQTDARFWSEILNLGAYDLLPQPFYEPEVRRILSNVCSRPAYFSAGV